MTREEAIKELTDLLPEEFLSEYAEAIRMAIEALKQEPCEDCISRQEVLDALDKSKYSNAFCEEHHIDWSINLGMAHIVVNELKPVSPQPKMGHWVKVIEENGHTFYLCSVCKEGTDENYDYCPFCGAKMSNVYM